MIPRMKTIASQPSWVVESDQVRLALTVRGGHMAPVTFYRKSARPVQPYYVNPWHAEKGPVSPPVLVPLRGDFFCMPFGADSKVKGVAHTTHGEPATEVWTPDSLQREGRITRFTLTIRTRKMPGRVTKTICLVDGQNVVYTSHLLEGYSGRTSLGHHATLALPQADSSMLISTSPILFGKVATRTAAFCADGEYYALQPGAVFKSLTRVPTVWKEMPYDDCSRFPRRRGFVDILQMYNKPGRSPAWATVAVPSQGYLWFTLKDPAIQPSTMLWMENYGRHQPPWNGRNGCIGVEDVCGYFADGLPASTKKNEISEQGIATAVSLKTGRPTAVNYIQGVAKTPRGFGRVASVRFVEDAVEFVDEQGREARTAVQHRFVYTADLS